MIKNERQYRITKAAARRFSDALKANGTRAPNVDARIAEASVAAAAGQLAELQSELAEYEALKSGQLEVVEVESLGSLANTLIKARIAAGLSQKDLGARLGLKEQQIQRYEETNYTGASLARLIEIANALNVSVRHEAVLGANADHAQRLLSRMEGTGLPRSLVLRRFVPPEVAQAFSADASAASGRFISELVARAKRVFGWNPDQLFGNAVLAVPSGPFESARFKIREGRNEARASAYTVYAHYLAMLMLRATEHLPQSRLPSTAEEFYDNVCLAYSDMTFENALRYIWSLGIPVLPLDDEGSFDGAYWRVDGRHVIVLKQNSTSAARWLFDLLHDYRHATQHPDMLNSQIVELPATSAERRDSADEVDASDFAGEVILAGNDEEVIEACRQVTQGHLQRLKQELPGVAQKVGVDLAAAANFMAYRLSLEGKNWWGTAAKLQPIGERPWFTARDILLEHVRFGVLAVSDQRLLSDALIEHGVRA
jgi:transcriptional regulator with XRE-family HTH domain/Zn-dependent peptidase ImmA (M78 family)